MLYAPAVVIGRKSIWPAPIIAGCVLLFQLMVGVDGACGLNYEHTTAEGPAIAALMDCILDYV